MSKNPVPDLVMQVDRSCIGTGFTTLFWLNMSGNPVQDLVMQVENPALEKIFQNYFERI